LLVIRPIAVNDAVTFDFAKCDLIMKAKKAPDTKRLARKIENFNLLRFL